ncbi:MAG: hypothetical protein ABW127_09775 [Candidatus Thiodiazotropha endolucinida]
MLAMAVLPGTPSCAYFWALFMQPFSISDNYILYEIMNNIIVNIAQLINPGIVGIARVAIRPV